MKTLKMNQNALFLVLSFGVVLAVLGVRSPKESNEKPADKDIHTRLAPNELKSIFGADDLSQVPDYEIVHPITVDENAKQNANAQQWVDEIKPLFLHFHAFGLDFHLNITKNTKHIPANQVIEHHSKEGVTRIKGRPNTSSTGKVTSDPNSKVVLDHTSGLSGMISRDEGTFIISPLPSHLAKVERSFDSHGAHAIYRRSLGSESSSCSIESSSRSVKRSLPRQRRSTGARKAKNMELMIVADVNMVKFYGKKFLNTYLVNQGNMINSFFTDPTLSYPINVFLTRVVLLEEDVFAGAASMKDLLPKFRSWLSKNNPPKDSDPLHVDNAVLYTKNGCANGCGLSGYARVGMCGTGDSVVKDRGLMTAIVASHEIAHNLGLDHDGIKGLEKCPNGINIMATSNTLDGRGFEWSKCSSEYLAKNLESFSPCFDDKPDKFIAFSNIQLFGKVYNGDKQCELAKGKDFRLCKDFAGDCKTLKCEHKTSSSVCSQTIYPAAHGTWCGNNRWCIFGECVRDGTTPTPPINGGWTPFSNHLPCNRPCGGGATWRVRTCTNPAPKNGGKKCEGETITDRKICNMQACTPGAKSFRLEQCQASSSEKVDVTDNANPCRLICKTPGQSAWVSGTVKDGTVTSAAMTGICLKGIVREIGCDLKMESGAIHDRCGICNGDGSTCTRKSGSDTKHYSKDGGQHELLSIPKGSWEITVEELGKSGRYLGLKVGSSNNLAYYLPSWTTNIKAAGTTINYIMEDYDYPDKIYIKGKINQKIRIFYVDIYGYPALGLKWKYFAPAEGDVSPTEYFAASQWGKCSKTCAGGTQTRKVKCRRTDDKSLISPSFCASNKKIASSQACNTQACPPEWHIYPWSPCSKSCGSGMKKRLHTCSELRADQKYHTIDDSRCKTTKPKVVVEQVCNAFDCLAEWSPGNWSECSTTCNAGIKTRKVVCKRTKTDGTVSVVHSLECSAILPSIQTKKACNDDKPCSGWVVKYSACSKTCGGGMKTPYVECSLKASVCSPDKKPDVTKVSSIACNKQSCPTYAWVPLYGDCVATCGSGKMAMILHCKESTGKKVSNSICVKKNAKLPIQKQCLNLPACPQGDMKIIADYYLIGCYKDNKWTRRVPKYLDNFRASIDWNNMGPTVDKCASVASSKSYKYFAIQFYGECWAGGDEVATSYDHDGPSANCYNGTGGESVNFIYRFGRRTLLPPVLPMGCFNGTFTDMVKDFKDEVDWTKPIDDTVVAKISSKCAIAAAKKGYAAFGLKYPGQCWSGPLVQVTYSKGGPSNACRSELGGTDAYYVYKFIQKPS